MLVRYPKVDDICTVLIFQSINLFIQKTEKGLLKIYIYMHIYINIKGYEMLWSYVHLFKTI